MQVMEISYGYGVCSCHFCDFNNEAVDERRSFLIGQYLEN